MGDSDISQLVRERIENAISQSGGILLGGAKKKKVKVVKRKEPIPDECALYYVNDPTRCARKRLRYCDTYYNSGKKKGKCMKYETFSKKQAKMPAIKVKKNIDKVELVERLQAGREKWKEKLKKIKKEHPTWESKELRLKIRYPELSLAQIKEKLIKQMERKLNRLKKQK